VRGENAQTVYRTERTANFTQLPNESLRDERLSFRARGLLAFMLSFPDDWQHRDLEEHGTEGREAVRSALRELEACGYREKVKRRDEQGRIRTFVILRDQPTDAQKPVRRLTGDSVDRASIEHGHEDCHEDPSSPTETQGEEQSLVEVPKPTKERPRNLVFDALASVYPAGTKSEQGLIGVVAAELKQLRPVPDVETIVTRARWALREWPGSTPKALAQHWTMIGERVAGAPPGPDDAPADPQSGMDTSRRDRR